MLKRYVINRLGFELGTKISQMETRLIDLISLQAAGGAIINIMQYTSICTFVISCHRV